MDLDTLNNQFDTLDREINHQVFKRNQLKEQLKTKYENLEDLRLKRAAVNKSSLFVKSRAYNVRKNSTDITGQMVSDALKPMYGEDYEFSFAYNEDKLAKGERSGFNIQPTIISDIDGIRMATSVQNARGGGLVEVVSVLLRFAFLKLLNYNGLIVLDETWASVSADEKMVNLIDFLNDYVKEADIQVLFITHRAEMFGKSADNILKVSKTNGIAKVTNITYNDIVTQRVDV